MKFNEFRKDGSTLAVRTINRYADETGPDSMDYDMFKKSALLLDKQMLKSLAKHIEMSDTAPREYVMKTIADHDPETFKKMYGDQEGYLSVMKPDQDLKDDNTDTAWNKYGLTASHKDGKFHSYRHGKLTGSFDSAEELAKHQKELIQNEDEGDERAIAAMKLDRDEKVDYANMMFHGKEIDHNSIDYEMQDYGDMIFELHGAKYIDGTPLTDEELEEFEKTDELIDWVAEDYASSGPDAPDESVSEDAGLTDQQKQGLQAVHNKFKGRVTSAGGSLPYEYLNYEIEPELYSDMIDSQEEDKAAKAFGYDSLEDVQSAMDDGEIEGDYPEDIEKYIPITMNAWAAVDSVLKGANDEQRKAARDYLLSISESAVQEDAGSLQNHNKELNRITKLAGLGEGASMLPYFKQDEKTWSFPDAWAKDEALDTPYMSNMSMRQFLDTLGYDSDFEQSPPVDAKEFIGRTTQWLQKNIDNPSKQIPTTVDRSGGGATMIGGGKPEGWDNRQVKHHNELARKILTKYPEVTHFGFN